MKIRLMISAILALVPMMREINIHWSSNAHLEYPPNLEKEGNQNAQEKVGTRTRRYGKGIYPLV